MNENETNFNIKDFLKKNVNIFLVSALTAYIITSVVNLFLNKTKADSLNFIKDLNGAKTIAIFVMLLAVIFCLSFIKNIGKKAVYSLLLVSVLVFACLITIDNYNNVYMAVGTSAVVCFFIYYIFNNGVLFENKIINNYKISFIAVGAAFILMTVFLSSATIARYKGFGASNFDFGIFAQLFENMAKSGSTVISVERNELMSHFFNHFSPIYYVLLPLYMPFRKPEALLVIQAAFVCGSAFPVCLLGKKYGFKPLTVMLLGLLVLVLPGFVSPLFYDFHENKFLLFFLLWFIYFFTDKKYIPAYIFMILTLMIKEDAAIYVIFTLLFFMFVKKDIKFGFIGLGITVLYFVPVMIFMRKYGLDFVGWRYGVYFLEGQNKIPQMIINILMNPAFFIKNVFGEECFVFMLYMLGSLLFIPLMTKDFKKFVLLIPFVAINVMTDYKYQHDIGFQYTYGSLALMIVLFMDNIKDLEYKKINMAVFSALAVSVILTLCACTWKFTYYTDNYKKNKESYKQTEEALDRIPEGVSVTASTYILPHLYDYEELYMFKSDNFMRTDYYVLDSGNQDEIDSFEENSISEEYIKCLDDKKAKIYKLPEAPELLEE